MEDKNTWCVYMHIFPNDKKYIGITSQNVKYRWRSDGSGYKPRKNRDPNSSRIWNAIQKYGWENVQHKILFENLSKNDACEKEVELIALYKSNDKRFGYNISLGGDVVDMSDETKKKISKARKGKNYGLVGENSPMYGKHHTEEAKRKISESQLGVNHHMYGKHHTEQTRNKELISHLDEAKPVEQYDKNGNLIGLYISIHEASRVTGILRCCINDTLRCRQKTAGKYIWKYSEIDSFTLFDRFGSEIFGNLIDQYKYDAVVLNQIIK